MASEWAGSFRYAGANFRAYATLSMASDKIGAADEDGGMTTDSLRLRVLRVGVIGIVVVACLVAAVYYVKRSATSTRRPATTAPSTSRTGKSRAGTQC